MSKNDSIKKIFEKNRFFSGFHFFRIFLNCSPTGEQLVISHERWIFQKKSFIKCKFFKNFRFGKIHFRSRLEIRQVVYLRMRASLITWSPSVSLFAFLHKPLFCGLRQHTARRYQETSDFWTPCWSWPTSVNFLLLLILPLLSSECSSPDTTYFPMSARKYFGDLARTFAWK